MNKFLTVKNNLNFILVVLVSVIFAASAQAQMEAPAPEMEILKKDVGEWECEIKTWASPDAKPITTKGSETSRLLGGHWLITDFQGKMMGLDFKGHGNYGYDKKTNKYVGTWIDSMGPYMMHTEGTYDKATETLTVVGDAPGPDGATEFTYTMSTNYSGGKRVMTMYMQPKGSGDDKKMKFFEIAYTKKAGQ